MSQPKVTVLYHANCPDGMTAAWVAHEVFGDTARYVPVLYGQTPPTIPAKTEHIYVLDFSYPRAQLQEWGQRTQVLVLDHHETAADELRDPEGFAAEFDMERSGAGITWDYFDRQNRARFTDHGVEPGRGVGGFPTRPRIVNYAEDRDLWRFRLPHSRAISYWMRSFPYDMLAWHTAAMRLEDEFEAVVRESAALLTLVDQQVSTMCQQSRWAFIGEWHVPVVNATVFFSEVGEELCRLHNEAPFAAYYMDRRDGHRQWGLRSTGFNVAEVAKRYGGGGHAQAAGFTTEPTWAGEPEGRA